MTRPEILLTSAVGFAIALVEPFGGRWPARNGSSSPRRALSYSENVQF
jgi:hypothetical protein